MAGEARIETLRNKYTLVGIDSLVHLIRQLLLAANR
jgi:hypothetical protein